MIWYYLYKFLKRKEEGKTKKALIKNYYHYISSKNLKENPESQRILFINTRPYNSIEDAIIGEGPKRNFVEEYLYVSDAGNYYTSSYKRYNKYYDVNCPDLDNYMSSMGFCTNLPIYIPDLNMNGKIVNMRYAIFREGTSSVDMYSKILKVLCIDGSDGSRYYRLPTQVTVLKKIPQLHLSNEFKNIIEDYLLDVIDSRKFNVSIVPKFINNIPSFVTSIEFKQFDISAAKYIFTNIDLLKKRLKDIDECDVEVEDINKNGISLKIYKFPVRE
jgi:hypothetical protein